MAFLCLLLVGLHVLLATPALASPTSVPVRVSVTEAGGGVRIVYDLAEPTTELAIGPGQGRWPSDRYSLAEQGLRVEDGAIRAAAPFRRATLLVLPDQRDVDARYPMVTAVAGQRAVLFAPYFLPAAPHRLRVSTGGGRTRAVGQQEAGGGYVLVGGMARRGRGFAFLTGEGVAPADESHLHERAERLLLFYAARLRQPVPRRPTIVIVRQQEPIRGPAGFRGDVTRNGIVLLRFRAAAPGSADSTGSARATSFLAHELFHLWNAPGGGSGGLGEAWLHEGSANYYSWLAVSSLWPSELQLEAPLQRALDMCMRFGGGRPLASLDPRLRYECGAVLHWMSDLAVRQGSSGARSGFDLWARLVRSREPDSGYALADFRALHSELAPSAAALLDAPVGSGWDWPAIARLANGAGAEVTLGDPGDQALRFAAARAVAGGLCTSFGGGGWNARNEYYFTGQECGDLGDTVYLISVAGIDPMADAAGAYRAVERACGERTELLVRLRADGEAQDRNVRCRGTFEAAPPDLRIRRALPLNPRARSSP